MNDHDLEDRLAKWRPADPPPDLLRRLRAAAPPVRAKGSWPMLAGLLGGGWRPRALACAGALAALALVLAVRQIFPPRLPGPAGQPHATSNGLTTTQPTAPPPEHGGTDADGARRVRGGSVDLGDFVKSGLRYAVLDVDVNANPGGSFHLDEPPGPMRLDCGYTLPGGVSDNAPFGRFRLNVGEQF